MSLNIIAKSPFFRKIKKKVDNKIMPSTYEIKQKNVNEAKKDDEIENQSYKKKELKTDTICQQHNSYMTNR